MKPEEEKPDDKTAIEKQEEEKPGVRLLEDGSTRKLENDQIRELQ